MPGLFNDEKFTTSTAWPRYSPPILRNNEVVFEKAQSNSTSSRTPHQETHGHHHGQGQHHNQQRHQYPEPSANRPPPAAGDMKNVRNVGSGMPMFAAAGYLGNSASTLIKEETKQGDIRPSSPSLQLPEDGAQTEDVGMPDGGYGQSAPETSGRPMFAPGGDDDTDSGGGYAFAPDASDTEASYAGYAPSSDAGKEGSSPRATRSFEPTAEDAAADMSSTRDLSLPASGITVKVEQESFVPASPTYTPPTPSSPPSSAKHEPQSSTFLNAYSKFEPQSPTFKPSSPQHESSSTPSSSTYKPSSPIYKPSSPAYKPSSPEFKPSSPQFKPSSPEFKPSSPQFKPSSPGFKPSSPEFKPSSPEFKPSSPGFKPSSPQFKPSSPEFKPSSPEFKPSSPEFKPSSPSFKPPTFEPSSSSFAHSSSTYSPSSKFEPHFADYAPGSGACTPDSPMASPRQPNSQSSMGGYARMGGTATPPSPTTPLAGFAGGMGGFMGAGGWGEGAASNGAEQGDEQEHKPLSVAERMMMKMGYREGQGLGKDGSGITSHIVAIEKQDRGGLGKTGGFQRERVAGKHITSHLVGDIPTEVYVEWVHSNIDWVRSYDDLLQGLDLAHINMCDSLGDDKASPTADYATYATDELAMRIKSAKSSFDNMDRNQMRDAVGRCNPYEHASTKAHHIFQNRAAMKMAEVDWLFNLTARNKSNADCEDPTPHDHMLYFADVCAGPGGFTEYLFWRRQLAARGWGFTLRGDHDFRVDKFNETSPVQNFKVSYGEDNTGDVYKNENMRHFAALVDKSTGGLGLQLMVADGGDSVDGEFLRQEWLMRRLALCQATTALLVLREGGDFFCKIFDTFTPFLHDLLFLLSQVFKQMAVFKPLTSRPANSERYIVCMGLLHRRPPLADYLLHVNSLMDEDPKSLERRDNRYVRRIARADDVPDSWTDYLRRANMRIGEAQARSLEDTMKFYEDPMLDISDLQRKLAKDLITCWGVPETKDVSKKMLEEWAKHTRPPHVASTGDPMFAFDPVKDAQVKPRPKAAVAAGATHDSMPGRHQGFNAGEGSHQHVTMDPFAPPSNSSSTSAPTPRVKTGPDFTNPAVLAALQKKKEAAQKTQEDLRKQQELQKQAAAEAAIKALVKPETHVKKVKGDKDKTKDKAEGVAKVGKVKEEANGGQDGKEAREGKEKKEGKGGKDGKKERNGKEGNGEASAEKPKKDKKKKREHEEDADVTQGKRQSKKKKGMDDEVVGDEALKQLHAAERNDVPPPQTNIKLTIKFKPTSM